MRTTIDLPDDLYRRAKATAARRGMKLKDLVAEMLERGLNAPTADRPMVRERRTPFPINAPTPPGGPLPNLTNEQIADLIEEDDQRS